MFELRLSRYIVKQTVTASVGHETARPEKVVSVAAAKYLQKYKKISEEEDKKRPDAELAEEMQHDDMSTTTVEDDEVSEVELFMYLRLICCGNV